ncbi:MAG: 4-(cytidine 5'-diphospho)-2-C-methyl-D-erythritol kinase [Gemmatimonadota bacterium]|nr:4-(cytidine 5'-diphospho)-2-C-methyl-D-erythritol kinase [Gemmatimonadota bacterium]
MRARTAAPAKVNLFLRVLGKRHDGFHEIRTVFQAIDLVDEVVVERGGRGVTLDVRGAELGPEEENLAYRAAESFLAHGDDGEGARIELVKRIPAGAGLGGGSSDAAAVLRCLAATTSPAPSAGDLARMGAALGSDVPFFLSPGPLALAEGRGDVLVSVPPLPEADLVVALPPVHVATAAAYGALRREAWVGDDSDTVGDPTLEETDPTAFGRAGTLDVPRRWEDVASWMANDFQPVVAGMHEAVGHSLAALERAGARATLLSGSGGASFGLFGTRDAAKRVASELTRRLGWRFVATRTLSAWPDVTVSGP